MRRLLSILLALGLIVSFSLATAVPALAESEVWVDDDFDSGTPGWGVTHFDSIQDGIDAADLGGATVHVADGTYNEHDINLKNGVAVLGAGAGSSIINGTSSGSVVTAGSTVLAGTVLDGFTITGGANSYGGGMYNNHSAPTVSNCVFTGNMAGSGGGMYNNNYASPTVVSCIFTSNTSFDTGGAIECRDHSSPNIGSCVIAGNTAASDGGAIYVSGTSQPTIINNTIADNTATAGNGGGIYVNGSSAFPTVTNNIIANNSASSGSGIYCANPSLPINYNDIFGNDLVGCTETDDITDNPLFVGGGDYHLQGSSTCINAGDTAAVPGWLDDDFEGNPRVWENAASPRVDIGADEYFNNDPPNTPDNLGPTEYINGDPVDDDTPTLEFTQDDPNIYDTVRFTIQIDDDSGFPSPLVDYTSELLAQGAASFTVGQAEGSGTYTTGSEGQTLPDGDYYWQVMSTDQYGATSGWAVAHGGGTAFIVDTSPPTPPGGAVGGTVYPVDKAALRLPWFALSAALLLALAAGGLILLRRPKP